MGSIAQEVRERKQGIGDLLKILKGADTAIEKLERKLKALKQRKRALPTLSDLDVVVDIAAIFFKEVGMVKTAIETLGRIFQL